MIYPPLKANDNRHTAPQSEPRLLNETAVAAMMGYSRTWFIKHRARLESAGFPVPIAMGQGQHGGKRWDRVAIDLWLNRQISPSLLPSAQPGINDLAPDWENTLINRAASIGKGEPHHDAPTA